MRRKRFYDDFYADKRARFFSLSFSHARALLKSRYSEICIQSASALLIVRAEFFESLLFVRRPVEPPSDRALAWGVRLYSSYERKLSSFENKRKRERIYEDLCSIKTSVIFQKCFEICPTYFYSIYIFFIFFQLYK